MKKGINIWEDKEMKEEIKMRKEERKWTNESIRGEDESG